jgi:hypothetical protein
LAKENKNNNPTGETLVELIRNFTKWQGVANYLNIRKNLPSWGKTCIMLGIFNLALGILPLLIGEQDILAALWMLN